ncbi:uncharacterized protein N7459_007024 [Penicillium hispanicum]|uniref:uncharacterized protein n=1 Tax=Penicillium hispanicum TaxID=1080232 RepID=UPI0025412EF7|nr:uncharacterized protein N7459_007024 [Penicillium hispanicum]KAJ5578060.1 hypothetical protein N7459_007024 [Penicillium hispanicum]
MTLSRGTLPGPQRHHPEFAAMPNTITMVCFGNCPFSMACFDFQLLPAAFFLQTVKEKQPCFEKWLTHPSDNRRADIIYVNYRNYHNNVVNGRLDSTSFGYYLPWIVTSTILSTIVYGLLSLVEISTLSNTWSAYKIPFGIGCRMRPLLSALSTRFLVRSEGVEKCN